MPTPPTSSDKAVKAVAFFEAFKGVLAFLVATGALALIHKDVSSLAMRLVEHSHLNPAAKYPGIFLEAASHFQDSRILLLALGALIYSVVRLIEAYGLYNTKPWAELLAAGSGSIYVPAELVELNRHPSLLGLGFLVVNLLVVVIMIRALLHKRANRKDVA